MHVLDVHLMLKGITLGPLIITVETIDLEVPPFLAVKLNFIIVFRFKLELLIVILDFEVSRPKNVGSKLLQDTIFEPDLLPISQPQVNLKSEILDAQVPYPIILASIVRSLDSG